MIGVENLRVELVETEHIKLKKKNNLQSLNYEKFTN